MKFPNFNLYVNKRRLLSTGLVAFLIGGVLGGILWNFGVPLYTPGGPLSPIPNVQVKSQLNTFSSYEELKSFVNTSSQFYPYYEGYWFFSSPPGGAVVTALSGDAVASAEDSSVDYSTTNIQVAGVDEADIVKTDGEYIYVVSGNNITILKAYPAGEARVLSEITLNGTVGGIFINGDKLVVFEGGDITSELFIYYDFTYDHYRLGTFIKVYDVSDRESPVLTRALSLNGSYFNSRMIGDYVYAVVEEPVTWVEDEVVLPKIYSENRVEEVPAWEIYYSNVSDYYYKFTTIVAVNVQDDLQEPTHKTFLLGAARNMYVSLNNIYITFTGQTESTSGIETTSIHKIHIENGWIEYAAFGAVPGTVLNQFSMDEYASHFRIATTTGNLARSLDQATSRNHVYVLDVNLNIVGKLEDLAPGEKIHSARFMGDRCYVVTFRKIDPLFVIDLENPNNPEVLGYLKITGYSDYLHPYDEHHIIGIGKETVAAEEGDFAWYQGVKISLFDVSDVENPKEIAKYEIGDRGTDSPILRDHKAFLFDKTKNLLVIPVLVAEIDETKYPYGVPSNAYGDYVWQGAYVFRISLAEGLSLRGAITHIEDDAELNSWYSSPYFVQRSLYIDNVLYTISDKKIKMNSLENLAEINEIELP